MNTANVKVRRTEPVAWRQRSNLPAAGASQGCGPLDDQAGSLVNGGGIGAFFRTHSLVMAATRIGAGPAHLRVFVAQGVVITSSGVL